MTCVWNADVILLKWGRLRWNIGWWWGWWIWVWYEFKHDQSWHDQNWHISKVELGLLYLLLWKIVSRNSILDRLQVVGVQVVLSWTIKASQTQHAIRSESLETERTSKLWKECTLWGIQCGHCGEFHILEGMIFLAWHGNNLPSHRSIQKKTYTAWVHCKQVSDWIVQKFKPTDTNHIYLNLKSYPVSLIIDNSCH